MNLNTADIKKQLEEDHLGFLILLQSKDSKNITDNDENRILLSVTTLLYRETGEPTKNEILNICRMLILLFPQFKSKKGHTTVSFSQNTIGC